MGFTTDDVGIITINAGAGIGVLVVSPTEVTISSTSTGSLDFKGGYDVPTDTPAILSGAGVLKGDFYVVTVAGTFLGNVLEVGDSLFANIDTPTLATEWTFIQGNTVMASETVPGIIELATQAETNTGTDDLRAVTPLKFKSSTIDGYVSGAGVVVAGDTILQAIQKLNGNTSALVTGVSSVNLLTGAVALTGTANRISISVANVFDIGSDVVTLTSGQALSNKTGNISQWTNDSGYITTAGWGLLGNSVLDNDTNFIGSTNDRPFNIRVNNLQAGKIYSYTPFTTTYGYEAGKNNAGDAPNNTFIGYQSGKANTSAIKNTFLGFQSGLVTTTGSENVAIGYFALKTNVGGLENVAIGSNAMKVSTSALVNVAIGSSAFVKLTTGSESVAVGAYALQNTTTGNNNVAVGVAAGGSNTTGSNNTYIGYLSNTSVNNLTNSTAIGNGASVGISNTMVFGNASVTNVKTSGTLTLGAITILNTDGTSGQVLATNGAGATTWATLSSDWSLTGNAGTIDGTNFIGTTDNIPFNIRVNNQKAGKIDATLNNSFYGYLAGNANTTGASNVAIGTNASGLNLTGYQNLAIGVNALYSNLTNNNGAIGTNALQNNTNGYHNYAFGVNALVATSTGLNNIGVGHYALSANTIGSQNIAFGTDAGNINTTGSNNIYIGTNANAGVGLVGLSNSIAIGVSAIVEASNTIQLGNTSITNVKTSGTVTIGAITILNTDGIAGQVLSTDGAGVTSWATSSGGLTREEVVLISMFY